MSRVDVDGGLLEIDDRDAHLLAQNRQHILFLDEAHLDQDLVDAFLGILARGHGGLKLIRLDLAFLQQDVANAHFRPP